MHSQLHELLRAIRECSQRLLDVLQEENQALRRTNADTIDRITAAKQTLIREMESHQLAQDRCLAALNLPPGPPGMRGYIDTLPSDAPEAAVWKEIRALVGECRTRNEINGGLAALNRRHVQQALEIL